MSGPCPITRIIKRNGNLVAYDRERITAAIFKATAATGHANRDLAEGIAAKVELALVEAYSGDMMPTVEDIQDIAEKTLIENRLARLARNYIIYRHERAMLRAARAYSFEVTDNIPYKKIYEVLLWNMAHKCETVEGLNAIVRSGHWPELVHAAENRFADDLMRVTQGIIASKPSAGDCVIGVSLVAKVVEGG